MTTETKSNNSLCTSDISHPSVDLIEVTAHCKGNFDAEPFREAVKPWCAKHKVPMITDNGLNVALKRAMGEISRGKEKDLKTIGRKGMSVYTLTTTDLSRADLELDDGKGIGHAVVSARIEVDPNTPDSFSIKVSPDDAPQAATIRQAFDRHCGLYSGTYDVKPWLTQKVFPALGAMRSPDAQGKYMILASDESRSALKELEKLMLDVDSSDGGKVRMYLMGRVASDASIVDLIADAMDEEVERVCSQIDSLLSDGKKTLGKRGLASQMKRAEDLEARIQAMAEAAGAVVTDTASYIQSVQARLGMASMALDTTP